MDKCCRMCGWFKCENGCCLNDEVNDNIDVDVVKIDYRGEDELRHYYEGYSETTFKPKYPNEFYCKNYQ